MLIVALVMAAGTLAGMSFFQQGATERAVYALAATWAIVMMTATGWLIPMGEPYRTSRVLGEKLAALAAKLNVEPVLLEYQEPGVVYSLGISHRDDSRPRRLFCPSQRGPVGSHGRSAQRDRGHAQPLRAGGHPRRPGRRVCPGQGEAADLQLAVVHEGEGTPAPPALDAKHAPGWFEDRTGNSRSD